MVPTKTSKNVCRSAQYVFFTYYQQKTFQQVSVDYLQITKTCLTQNIAARAIWSDIIVSLQTGFCPLLIMLLLMYANKQVAIYIKYSQGSFPSLRLVHIKSRPEKFPFLARNKSLRVNCWKMSYVTSKCQIDFLDKTCGKRSKTETVKITIKSYIFKIVQVPNFTLN